MFEDFTPTPEDEARIQAKSDEIAFTLSSIPFHVLPDKVQDAIRQEARESIQLEDAAVRV